MRRPRRLRHLLACAVVASASLLAPHADAALRTAVEFYNPKLRHYFVTADAAEAAALDAGNPVGGWVRTGGRFSVYADGAEGGVPVCRFFGTPGLGLDSHFYTADPAECAKVKTYPAWTYEGIAWYADLPSSGGCKPGTQPVWRNYFSDNVRDANHRFTVDLTVHVRMPAAGFAIEGLVMCAPLSPAEVEADAVRLLEQASLGPTEALVAEVVRKGAAAWVDEQLRLNVTRYTQLPDFKRHEFSSCLDDLTPPYTPEKRCMTYKGLPTTVAWEFFRQSKTAPDQLRMRMAHAWHQIFVLGEGGPTEAYAHAEFQQRLRDGALGSFESLLTKFTLSPHVGEYQNWVYNVPEHDGVRPNENFGRELMQLFSIGVNVLEQDGTLRRDAAGAPIPAYSQADVEAMSRVLTGYTHPARPGATAGFWENDAYFIGDMIPFDDWHDQGAKSLLGRLELPAGGGAAAEVHAALRMLVDHPNSAPFISRQLIQKTVTSSPTPGYVARVAAVFRDNGTGMRGDLAAVTRAILLDPEARGARKIDPQYGRLREPALFWTAMLRALDVATDGAVVVDTLWPSGQNMFRSRSVFNYYPADFTLAGGAIPAPEFGIYTSAEFLNRANLVNDLLYNVDQPWNHDPQWGWGKRSWVVDAIGTPSPTLEKFLPDASNVDALVDRLDRLFLHGTMPPDMRRTIVDTVSRIDPAQSLRRVKMAVNLVLVSVDYQVQK